MDMPKTAALALALTLAPGLALAGGQIEERRPAPRDGVVAIENAAGAIRVVGWDRAEVAVRGSLGSGATGLELTGERQRTVVSVETSGHPQSVHSDLEVHVPAGSRLEIEGFGANITVSGVTGSVSAESVNGSISVTGEMKEVRAESVNGGIEVMGPARRVYAESVNGPVTVRGAAGEVEASSVNGRVAITGGTFTRGRMETVNGRVRFEGALGEGGWLEVESVSGSVDLVFTRDVSAAFWISTFSGSIDNEFGPAPRSVSRHTTEKELSFSTGDGKGKVSVHTLSGHVSLRKQ